MDLNPHGLDCFEDGLSPNISTGILLKKEIRRFFKIAPTDFFNTEISYPNKPGWGY
jgi:hypothetical protein